MKKLTILIFLFLSFNVYSQNDLPQEVQDIVNEGILMYKSEMASWYGTDLFLEKYDNLEKIGGYFSYSHQDSASCVFYSKDENPKVIGTITFDNSYKTENAIVNLTERDFKKDEYNLFEMRRIAKKEILNDTLFKSYKNTSLNIIPLISNGEKKVYVLTGPKQTGVVIFGNDYLLTFDANNNLRSKKELHKNIIPITYNNESDEVGAVHSHLPETGDFITATDICTLMLYSKFTKWKTHNVFSENYLNIWNCETNTLNVIPMKTVKKINKDQKKKKKKK